MENYKVLTLKDYQEWINALKSIPSKDSDFYYHPSYYNLYEKYGDGTACCFVFTFNNECAIYPFLINEINTLFPELNTKYYDIQGAYGYNGVISTSKDSNFINKFHLSFKEYINQNNIVAEFTRFHPILENINFSKNYLDVFYDRTTVGVNLENKIEDIRSNYSKTVKKNLKVAKNNNLEVKILENNFEIDLFIKIYQENMKRVSASKYLFFNNEYFNNLFSLQNCVQFIVYHNNTPIASSICFYSKSFFHYHLASALTDYLKYCPNNILMDCQIEFAHKNKFKYIHLGGGLSSNDEDTLFKFKKGYSSDHFRFSTGKKIHNKKIYNKIINLWESKNPEKKDYLKNILLKYRL